MIDDDTSLERNHIADSAQMIDLLLFLEKTFSFEISNEEALPENFDTINSMVAYVVRKSDSDAQ